MVDTSRHFISLPTLKRVIESLPISKLNAFHWHLTDDEAFPVSLGSHPELANSGSYSKKETYSV
jgi:hexosaminidase